ncbi:hypothetical protein ES332_A03G002100v1 [Gossypium tomentosum]|uniref:Disease resistance R13L4/SHOC-2-like LRR domain-containing protein n=1 Tax=Gossypium tomentosum TaxID=34277 RepID=A0A5D2R0B1_GOSTO|nr:hypothetical protein ES332_A03G002100v1 [Gossypium tomentosum]
MLFNHPLSMAKTIENLSHLSTKLSAAAKSNAGTSDKLELDAASKEVRSLIEEVKEQQSFETDLSEPLTTLNMKVDSIVKDPNMENGKWELMTNKIKDLRSSMAEVKSQLHWRKVPMGKVIESLSFMYARLIDAAKPDKASKLSSPDTAAGDPKSKDAAGDPKSKDETSESFELDKACNELKYLIDEFKKLQVYETNLSDPLKTIQNNVDDILGDLNANADNVEWETIKRNLKVLRSNMTKVKAQLPLLHQTSSSTEARRLLTTTSREEASKLPSPYQADGILQKGPFFKEFQDRYQNLYTREKLCLLCFAIFPENAEVSERLLRFWWEGERLRPESESDKKTVNEILEEFVERGFIEPVYKRSGSKGSCYKMHPIVRCLIVRHAKEANFFYYDCKGYPNMEFFKSKKICLVKSEGPSWWSKDVLAFTKAREQAQEQAQAQPQAQAQAQAQPQAQEQPQAQQGKDKKQAEDETKTKTKNKQKQKLEEQERKEKDKKRKEDEKQERKEKDKKRKEDEKQERKEKDKRKEDKNQERKEMEKKINEDENQERKAMDKKRKEDEKQERKEKEKKRIEDEKKRGKLETKRINYLENLQTLFNVSKQFPELPEELFPKMKNIDVLYLGRWERTAERHMEVEDVNFLRGLKNMNKLRFFSLQGISGIKTLPVSIGMLQNLRILDLKACHNLEELPKEVGLLKMLSYLDLSECYLLDRIPTDLSKLSKLKVLKGFVISSNSPCHLTHLTTLSELEKLSISIHDDKFSIKEEESIKHFSEFKSLTKLKIAWGAGGTKKSHDKAKHPEDKKKTSEVSKLVPTAKVLEKYLKLPFLGSSKSVPEKGNVAVAPTTAKAGQDKNGDNAKKKKSGAVLQSNVRANNKDQGGRSPKPELKLEKLDIRCYPDKEPPKWLVPKTLTHLRRLYFRGGEVSHIPVANKDEKWNVETLRLKYLINIKMDWKQIQKQFPDLKLLEKVNCPQITFCPCDASGAWEKQA